MQLLSVQEADRKHLGKVNLSWSFSEQQEESTVLLSSSPGRTNVSNAPDIEEFFWKASGKIKLMKLFLRGHNDAKFYLLYVITVQ